MRTLFELQEEDYFKLVRVVSLQNNGYVNMIEITVIEMQMIMQMELLMNFLSHLF